MGLFNPKTKKYWIRCLTVKECAQIQGFPADYPWKGGNKEIITQIGNAVPPPLATTIASLLEKSTFAATPQNSIADTGSQDSEEED